MQSLLSIEDPLASEAHREKLVNFAIVDPIASLLVFKDGKESLVADEILKLLPDLVDVLLHGEQSLDDGR